VLFVAAFVLFMQTLVPGFANTWTDGKNYWAGNPMCNQPLGAQPGCDSAGNPTPTGNASALLCPNSPAIDAGAMPPDGFHCLQPGSALNQPKLPDGSYCSEWFGKAPDVGACEYVTAAMLNVHPPTSPTLTVTQ
jgi:hypothetical protein